MTANAQKGTINLIPHILICLALYVTSVALRFWSNDIIISDGKEWPMVLVCLACIVVSYIFDSKLRKKTYAAFPREDYRKEKKILTIITIVMAFFYFLFTFAEFSAQLSAKRDADALLPNDADLLVNGTIQFPLFLAVLGSVIAFIGIKGYTKKLTYTLSVIIHVSYISYIFAIASVCAVSIIIGIVGILFAVIIVFGILNFGGDSDWYDRVVAGDAVQDEIR